MGLKLWKCSIGSLEVHNLLYKKARDTLAAIFFAGHLAFFFNTLGGRVAAWSNNRLHKLLLTKYMNYSIIRSIEYILFIGARKG